MARTVSISTAVTADGVEIRFRKVPADKRGRTVKCPNKAHTAEPQYPEAYAAYHASWCRDANPSLPDKASRKSAASVEDRIAATTIGQSNAERRASILRK